MHPVPPAMAHHLASARALELRSPARPARLGPAGPAAPRRTFRLTLARTRAETGWLLVEVGLRLAIPAWAPGTTRGRVRRRLGRWSDPATVVDCETLAAGPAAVVDCRALGPG